jgi:hypothetical protein
VLVAMRSARRLGTALLAPALISAMAAGALLGLRGPAASASSASAAATRATSKPCVGVIVDGRLAGGTLHTACATGDPRSGLDALTDAGIRYAFVPRQPGQVCQLDGLPECSRNSADTYWSYWWRAKGSQHWVYATQGAASHNPKPGDTEGWVWQEGGRRQPPDIAFRTICPQAVLTAPKPSPSPTHSAAKASTRPSPEIPATPSRIRKTITSPLATDDPSMRAAPVTPPSGSASRSPSPSPSASVSSETGETSRPARTSAAAAGTGDGDDSSGSPPWAGLAVGAAAVALLGGAAVTRFRRTPGSS